VGRRKNILGALDQQLDPEVLRIRRKYRGNTGSRPETAEELNKIRSRQVMDRRAALGHKTVELNAAASAGIVYLRKQWGFESNMEAASAAVLHLVRLTRQGLAKLDLTE
jgi:hypothetical protein